MFLPSHTRPFIRANPLEQAVSEEQKNIDGKSIKIRFLLFFFFFSESLCVSGLTDLAGLTGAAPGRPQGGAALGLQSGSVDVDLTAVVLYGQPAGALHTVCGVQETAKKKKKHFSKTLLSAVNVVTVGYGSFRILFGTTCIFRWRGAVLTDSY